MCSATSRPHRRHGRREGFREAGLEICEHLSWAWEIYQRTHDRGDLKLAVRPLRPEFTALAGLLRQGPCYRYARDLLETWPTLWTFADHNRMEPSNNHAESALRGAVCLRPAASVVVVWSDHRS